MTVSIMYRRTGDLVCTYFSVKEIRHDDEFKVAKSCTLYFERDEEKDITIYSPLTINLEKFKVIID